MGSGLTLLSGLRPRSPGARPGRGAGPSTPRAIRPAARSSRPEPASSWRQPEPSGRPSVSPRMAATRNWAISSRVASRLGARSTAAARAVTRTAPSGPRTSSRCCISGEGGGATGGGGVVSPSRMAASRASASAPRIRSGRPRSFSRAARVDGRRWAISTSVRSGTTHEAGLSRRAASRSRHAARATSTPRSLPFRRPAPFTLRQALSGSGSRRASGPVAAQVLLAHPLGAPERLGPPVELVGERQQVDDVARGVLELGRREGAPAPVGVALALVQLDAEHPLEQVAQPLARPQPDEARRELHVREGLGPDPVGHAQEGQVGRGGVHHDLDLRIGDELGDRPQRGALDGVDQVHAHGRRELREAGHRGVGPLPEELQVDRDASLLAGLAHHLVHPGGVGDGLRARHARYPSRSCRPSRSARRSVPATSSRTSASASTPATASRSWGATGRARPRCCGSSRDGWPRTRGRSACRGGRPSRCTTSARRSTRD